MKRSSVLGGFVVLAATFAFYGLPAQAGLFDDEVARKQIAEQSKRIDELRMQSDGISSRLAKIEEALRNQSILELANQIELLKQEIKNLRGQVEVVNNSVETTAKRQRDMYVDLDTRLRRLEQPGGAPPAASGATSETPSSTGSAATAAAGTPPADETRMYEAAQQQRRIGNYQGAIAGFQGFLAQYPKSSLAHRAQYWIGDSYFNLRDYRNAIASQQKLMATYPDSASAPDAMLNIASSQAELGDSANARKTMDALVSRFPNSDAAEKARRRMTTVR